MKKDTLHHEGREEHEGRSDLTAENAKVAKEKLTPSLHPPPCGTGEERGGGSELRKEGDERFRYQCFKLVLFRSFVVHLFLRSMRSLRLNLLPHRIAERSSV
jgi:hypothetical protein